MIKAGRGWRRARTLAGKFRRRIRRMWWERKVGEQYRAWLRDSFSRAPASIDNPVTLSIIVPVFDPPIDFLRVCLDSVVTQTAKNWQLVISDDGSSDPAVVAFLKDFEETHADDRRIHIVRSENGGIAAACNRALEHASSSWFGWLDHDDQLNPRAVELMTQHLANSPETDIIYSDEDKIDVHGRHFDLYCKPDFSPELLLSQMYLCHFTAFRTELVRQIGGFRSNMDGAQDFDLALRLLPNVTKVIHVPCPLYHWRSWEQSTARSIDAKPWAQSAAARVQKEHLERTYGGGEVVPSRTLGLNEVHPRVQGSPRVTVIIPTIGTCDEGGLRLVDAAITSLREKERMPLEIIAVTTGVMSPIPGVDQQIVYSPSAGFNFSEAVNLGRRHSTGEYLFLVNDDTTVVEDDPVTRLLEVGQTPGVGITGCLLTYPDGRIQHAGIVLLPGGPTHVFIGKQSSSPGYFGSTLTPRNFSAVTAAAMLVRTTVFDQVGGFDTNYARDFNDVDFCLRVRDAGYRVAWTPYAHLAHHEGASIVRAMADPEEASKFANRWVSMTDPDPFYSPSLSPMLPRIYEAL